MAIILNASGEYLRRTANLPARDSYTICAWVYINSILGSSWEYFLNLENATSSAGLYHNVGYSLSDSTFHLNTSNTYTNFASSPSAGTWVHMYMRANATNVQAGWRALGSTSYNTVSVAHNASFTTALVQLGQNSWGDRADGKYAAIKIWDVALSDAEMEAEWMSLSPVKTASLNLWVPGIWTGSTDRVKDLSGNARDFTAGGTLTDGDGPPVPWGGGIILVGKAAAGGPATITGTGALQADAATIAGTAERQHTATGALAAQAATIAGTAERTVTGTGALSASASTVAGTAERVIKGTGALAAAASTVAGTAERSVTGTGALSSAAASIAGTALRTITGTGALSSQSATIVGTGQVGNVIAGTGALQAAASTIDGTAEREVKGTGALQSAAAAVDGTAERSVTGTGALTAQSSTVAGVAVRVITGTGALAAQAAVIDGAGTIITSGTVAGSGALAANDATMDGTGDVLHIAQPGAGSAKGRRAKPRRVLVEPEREEQEREQTEAAQAPQPEAKRARRTGKAFRGIQLQPDDEAQEAAAGLAQRTAELIAAARAKEAQNAAALAAAREAQAMLEAAVAIEAENEMIMLLLMAA